VAGKEQQSRLVQVVKAEEQVHHLMALAVAGERQKKGAEEAVVRPMKVAVGDEAAPM